MRLTSTNDDLVPVQQQQQQIKVLQTILIVDILTKQI
jgi:hypothetical protein